MLTVTLLFTKGQIYNGKIMSQGMESFLIVSQNAQLLHYATLLQYKPTKEHGNTESTKLGTSSQSNPSKPCS